MELSKALCKSGWREKSNVPSRFFLHSILRGEPDLRKSKRAIGKNCKIECENTNCIFSLVIHKCKKAEKDIDLWEKVC